MFWIAAVCALGVIVAAHESAAAERALTEFDAGSTVHLQVGDVIRIQLDRPANEPRVWRWPVIDEKIVKSNGRRTPAPPAKRAEVVTEEFSFIAVGPGYFDLCAELTDADDPTRVHARFPVALQVHAPVKGQATPTR
jgi:hypothetical protein